jgi:hypothetical protein
MDRRLVSGSVAALAAIVLATGGGTLAAFDDAADVPHSSAGAGVLQLDLGSAGTATTALAFTDLMPGDHTTKLLWIAANDAASTVPATLSLTVHHLVDLPGACAISNGKAEGEIASGIVGCQLTDGNVTGTPDVGTASRLLDVDAAYVPAAVDPSSCSTQAGPTTSLLPTSGPGDLYAAANANSGAGTTVPIVDANADPVAIAPGRGICVAVSAYWPPGVNNESNATPEHPVDNAAQGDSFAVDVRFDLTQVAS